MSGYREQAQEVEKRAQALWKELDIYRVPNPGDEGFDPSKPKAVVLDMFPYPSGSGLHIGHPLGYIATDVFSRYQRMTGKNVLHAMGYDAFGLPAEQYAIQTNQHPRITTEQNIKNITAQLGRLGLDHDPHRTFATTDPDYYRWTQWIFLQLFESFFDPTVSWKDEAGREVQGRARPITELQAMLESGAWRLDPSGVPVPSSHPEAGEKVALGPAEMRAALRQARLAYVDDSPVNWCPMLGTVLSNEEVTNEGLSERGNYPVYRRPLRQWVLRITAYSDRLISDLNGLDWPNGIVEMQRNWVGPSDGAKVRFRMADDSGAPSEELVVFTTRPDTIFGTSYMALAPEHPLVEQITTADNKAAVSSYIEEAALAAAKQKVGEEKEKTGVFTGAYAVNPVNGERIPVWVADYVLMEYGSGAVMGVPGHDERDFLFAQKMGLSIPPVVMPTDGWLKSNAKTISDDADALRALYLGDPTAFVTVFTGTGPAINSANDAVSLDGLETPEAKKAIIAHIEKSGAGVAQRTYKLRDWLFSRQRFWGEPFPIVYDLETDEPYAVADAQLPVELPHIDDFQPKSSEDATADPEPPLGRAKDWIEVDGVIQADGSVKFLGEGEKAEGAVRRFKRELNTMPNWAGSCWYYLRYGDPKNAEHMVEPGVERFWASEADGSVAYGSVDLYVGGAEHAVLHLLYSRFWHKVLYDLGHVSTPEPFKKLFNQGMITADAYTDSRGVYVDIRDVDLRDVDGKEQAFHAETGESLSIEPGKMGKRYKNGLPPEEVCDEYSADVLRMYEMYMGPLDASKPWRTGSIVGMMRFANGVWKTVERSLEADEAAAPDETLDRLMHKTIQKVSDDIEKLRMNTALASLIEFNNALGGGKAVHPSHARALVLMITPFAPHLGEELFGKLCPEEKASVKSVVMASWPDFDPAKTVDDTLQIVVQVNGKKRGEFQAALGTGTEELEAKAKEIEAVQRAMEGKQIRRVIVAPPQKPKLINLVVG